GALDVIVLLIRIVAEVKGDPADLVTLGQQRLEARHASVDGAGHQQAVVADHQDVLSLRDLEAEVHEVAPASTPNRLATKLATIVLDDRHYILLAHQPRDRAIGRA